MSYCSAAPMATTSTDSNGKPKIIELRQRAGQRGLVLKFSGDHRDHWLTGLTLHPNADVTHIVGPALIQVTLNADLIGGRRVEREFSNR